MNHRADASLHNFVNAVRIYELEGNPRCPAVCLENYINKLNKKSDSL